jgi:hypothetical protein
MKKFLVMGIALFVAVAVAAPAMAAKVDFSYGGVIRARAFSQSNFYGFGSDDDSVRFDYRLRLYFTYTASENLKLVTKFEIGDVIWGGPDTTGRVGADGKDVEVKNAYVDFNIPNDMLLLNAKVGTQPFVFMDSWIVDDDFTGAYLNAKPSDGWKVGLGYIGAQNTDLFENEENIDDYFLHVDYNCAPFNAQFVFFFQNAHDTWASADPGTLNTPVKGVIPNVRTFDVDNSFSTADNFFRSALLIDAVRRAPGYAINPNTLLPDEVDITAGGNQLFDVGLQLKYKDDVWSAYLNAAMNFGSVDWISSFYDVNGNLLHSGVSSSDYEGWMIDAGGAYYCGPWTFNLGGFYTSGPDDIKSQYTVNGRPSTDISWFTYPLATSKYFSEIIGGGIFDNVAPAHEDLQWRGYGFPTNLWTINVGAAWQVMPETKLALGYWYFSSSEEVLSSATFNRNTGLFRFDFDNSIGHEIDFNITQKVTDSLMLDLVAAYLVAGDAYSEDSDDDDAIELGARLQWSF